MKADFIIHAAPVGKARPRVTAHGTYTPKKTKDYEALVQREYKAQCRDIYFGTGAIAVMIEAYYPIPKSASKTKRQRMLSREIRPTVKPDFDNVCKAVCDALNGIAYYDDAQIVEVGFIKMYDDSPRVKVRIFSLDAI